MRGVKETWIARLSKHLWPFHWFRNLVLSFRQRRLRPPGNWVLAVAIAVPAGGTLHAQYPADELTDLKARVAELERQNAEMRQAFGAQPPPNLTGHDLPSWQSSVRGPSPTEPYLPAANMADVYPLVDAADEGYFAGNDLNLTATWNHGLELTNASQDLRIHIGGRTQFDTSWYGVADTVQASINVPYQDGVDFRRARLRADGTLHQIIEWAIEYDFVNSIRVRNAADTGTVDGHVTALTDAWWTFKELPLIGNLRIGNQKEQIGLEHIISSRFQPFIERSYNQDSFYGGAFNGFTPGIQAFNWTADEMSVWALGLFKPADNVFAYNANDGDYAVTGRITRLLWYAGDGSVLVHTGLSFRQFTTVGDRIRYRTRDALRAGTASTWPIPADTGVLIGDDGQFLNGELAAVLGPWTFQAEYLVSYLDDAQLATAPPGPNAGTITYHGGYVQLLYFLTDDHDNYNRRNGAFDRVIPRENYSLVQTDCGPQFGRGAWQVGLRYNYLDLNDNGINGGTLHNLTAGLNWFLNPNLKVQFNYIATHRNAPLAGNAGDGWIHGWGCRFAHDF